jgi:hypothetical protein
VAAEAELPPVAAEAELPPVAAEAELPPVAAEAELPPLAAEAELPPLAAEAELPPLAAEAPAEVPPLVADAPTAGWPAVDEIAEATPAPVAAPVTEDAWWDEPEPAPAAEPEDEARSGRFALGGFSQGPAQEALTAVAFRSPLADAPAADAIDLSIEGTINCDGSSAEVIAEEGFAPSREGFTVKVRAAGPGPFMVSGTFRVR